MATLEQTIEQKLHQEKIKQTHEPKTRCLVCKFETSPKMRCICLPGGGPVSEQASDNTQPGKENDLLTKANEPENKKAKDSDIHHAHKHKKHPKQPDLPFNLDIINDLILRNLLVIDNKSELGVLNISCQKFYHLDSEQKVEVQKFFKAIVNSHQDFLLEQKLLEKNCPLSLVQDSEKNITSLKFNSLNPKVYDAFIHHLNKQNLLPKPKPFFHKPEEDLKQTQQNNKKFNPTPFGTVPKPKGFQE